MRFAWRDLRTRVGAGSDGQDNLHAKRALWLLLIVSLLHSLDRQIVNILAEPIRRDLGLSDTQLGLLTGLAFALFYTILGLPLARFVDNLRSNRVRLISACLAVWSAMTVLCGFATNFSQLVLARVGVGVGEAGCTPAAHSLIADLVPKERLASALSFFGIGISIGGLLGMVFGGLLADLFGWRVAFFVAGMPGVLFAAIIWLAIREPRALGRSMGRDHFAEESSVNSLVAAIKELARSRAYLMMIVAASLISFLGYGKVIWQAVLFIRVHGLTPGETGLWLGITAGVAGALGMYLGGYLSERLGKDRASMRFAAPVVGLLVGSPMLVVAYLQQNWVVALVLISLPTLANGLFYGPTFSCAQLVVPPAVRAMASAMILFSINLIGLGLGPLFFGMLSDALAPVAGDESVRWVLVGAAALGFLPAWFFWLAGRHMERELGLLELNSQSRRARLAGE